jgi:hypothetical protein
MEPEMLLDFIASLSIGFLGSLHCLGMCGPLILAYSLQIDRVQPPASTSGALSLQSGVSHHLAFHLGRLTTYGFLGAVAGLLFHLVNLERIFFNLRSGLALVGGTLMILMGLALMRIMPLPGMTRFSFNGSWMRASFGRLLTSQGHSSKIVLGMAVGFLPCGLSWAMIVKAATTQNPPAGFLIMVAFGLGTVPALFLPGISASLLSLRSRLVGERLAALSVIAMGLILVVKGAKIFA